MRKRGLRDQVGAAAGSAGTAPRSASAGPRGPSPGRRSRPPAAPPPRSGALAVRRGGFDDVGRVLGVEQIGLDELEPVARLQALQLCLDDPRDHHVPAIVEQPSGDGPAQPSVPPVMSAVFGIRVVRAPLYLRPRDARARFSGRLHDRPGPARAQRRRRAAAARATSILKLTLGDRTGSVPAILREGIEPARELCPARGRGPGRAAASPHHERFGAQLDRAVAPRRRRARVRSRRTGRRTRPLRRADGGRPAGAHRHRPESPPAPPAVAAPRRGLADLAALPGGAGGQALPPGLPPRAARALA